VGVDGDSPAIVLDPAASVGEKCHVDLGAVPGHGLVDGVVDDLPDQMMETRRARRTDVHARALPDRLEALENRDVGSVVRGSALFIDHFRLNLQRHKRALSDPRTTGGGTTTTGPAAAALVVRYRVLSVYQGAVPTPVVDTPAEADHGGSPGRRAQAPAASAPHADFESDGGAFSPEL
jgi:hypothetical protein